MSDEGDEEAEEEYDEDEEEEEDGEGEAEGQYYSSVTILSRTPKWLPNFVLHNRSSSS